MLRNKQLKGKAPSALVNVFTELTERGQDALSQPFFAWIQFALTRIQENSGAMDQEELIAGYERAVKLGCAEAAESLAEVLESRGVQTAEERARIIELYELANSSQTLYNLGFIFQKGWTATSPTEEHTFDAAFINLERAEFYFRKSYSIDLANLDALTAIAETILLDAERLTEERIQEALALYSQAINAGSQEARYLRALYLGDAGKIGDAVSELTIVSKESTDLTLRQDAQAQLALLHKDLEV